MLRPPASRSTACQVETQKSAVPPRLLQDLFQRWFAEYAETLCTAIAGDCLPLNLDAEPSLVPYRKADPAT